MNINIKGEKVNTERKKNRLEKTKNVNKIWKTDTNANKTEQLDINNTKQR